MTANPLRNIIFEDAGNGYVWGQYDTFKILMKKRTGYANMTKLCEIINSRKRFIIWLTTNAAIKLINALTNDINEKLSDAGVTEICADKLVYEDIDVHDDYKGYYVHPRLIPAIIAWACPKFALKMSDTCNEFINKEARDAELYQKEDKDDNNETTFNEVTSDATDKHNRINEYLKEQISKISEALIILTLSDSKLDTFMDISETISDCLEHIEWALDRIGRPSNKIEETILKIGEIVDVIVGKSGETEELSDKIEEIVDIIEEIMDLMSDNDAARHL
jgi:hypothetical protein